MRACFLFHRLPSFCCPHMADRVRELSRISFIKALLFVRAHDLITSQRPYLHILSHWGWGFIIPVHSVCSRHLSNLSTIEIFDGIILLKLNTVVSSLRVDLKIQCNFNQSLSRLFLYIKLCIARQSRQNNFTKEEQNCTLKLSDF